MGSFWSSQLSERGPTRRTSPRWDVSGRGGQHLLPAGCIWPEILVCFPWADLCAVWWLLAGWLFLHVVMHICRYPSVSFTCSACKFMLYMHIGSSASFFCVCWYTVFVVLFPTSSLCMTAAKFFHIPSDHSISVGLWPNNILLYICTTSSLSFHLSMDI